MHLGILGAVVGWFLAVWLGIDIVIAGHPTVSKVVMASEPSSCSWSSACWVLGGTGGGRSSSPA
ncbi:MAG TPA: hypothetical protein VNG93_11095 [Candidatus Dormibacteraeota bacterium]|nr:hypothetical protein [Candidatus Dormibacteraeota bacterium]